MRIIFFGTPALCVPYLEMLASEYELVAVVCNPDQPVGRKQIMTPPPTKVWALENNVPVAIKCIKKKALKGKEETLQNEISILKK